MKSIGTICLAVIATGASWTCAVAGSGAQTSVQSGAQSTPSSSEESEATSTVVEYYYRIKWGYRDEFVSLYEKNHLPLLEEVQKRGFVKDIKIEYPLTHLAGAPRWDMRVRITYRDPIAAIEDPRLFEVWMAARTRMYKDLKKLEAEEAHRFSLLEEHWDVIVSDYPH